VTLGVTLSRCVCVRRVSLSGKGNALYPVLSGLFSVLLIIKRVSNDEKKCIPMLLYALEVCNLSKRDLQALDFSVNRFFYEITSNE